MISRIEQFNFQVDLLQGILWQYADAPHLNGLINAKQDWYNINFTEFWDDWFDNVFNLVTADVFGLSVWSIILGIPLFVPVNPEPFTAPIFGFNEVNPSPPPDFINTYQNFENGNFYDTATVRTLTPEQQRIILRLRYFQLTCRGAIPEINEFLFLIFQSYGDFYVLDNFDMTITYVIGFDISANLLAVIEEYDLLPRPAGVGLFI